MTQKKWPYLIGIFIIIIPILFFYNAFNGNPLSKFTAEKQLATHLETTYSGENLSIIDGYYEFKVNGYNFTVLKTAAEQSRYEFIMGGVFGRTVIYDGVYYAKLDESLMEAVQAQADQDLFTLLKVGVPELISLETQIDVLRGTYDEVSQFTPEFKGEKPFRIYVVIEADELLRADVLDISQTMQRILNEAGYDYDYVSINANLSDEGLAKEPGVATVVKYYLSFSPETKLKIKDVEQITD